MRIASALSTLTSTPALAQDIEAQLKQAAPEAIAPASPPPPDLLLMFVSSALSDDFATLTSMVRTTLAPKRFLAIAAESILGVDQEVERASAASALALWAPGMAAHGFHMGEEEWVDLLTDAEVLRERLNPSDEDEKLRAILMFADPFTTPAVQLMDACSKRFPRAPIIGGMASGIQNAGETRLALDAAVHTSGVVGVALSGNIEIDCVVSQGCRPIGETFVITKSHQNVIDQLDGKPALAAIEQMMSTLPLMDRQLVATGGLLVGRVIDAGKGGYGPGDFLIRSLIGVRRESGAILVGDLVRTGQTLQFHVRDAKAATEEMRLLLEGESLLAPSASQPAGALLVTCNGRGTRLFDMPHHDISLARQVLGAIPIAGFFAAGELGPVGERNFIHGHSAAMAVFREPEPAPT